TRAARPRAGPRYGSGGSRWRCTSPSSSVECWGNERAAVPGAGPEAHQGAGQDAGGRRAGVRFQLLAGAALPDRLRKGVRHPPRQRRGGRSEEHTSELQSRENLVCRLLLEKKKTTSK